MTFEYKIVVIDVEKTGFLSSKMTEVCRKKIEAHLNDLGKDGWELVGVLPFTNGQSPAQIDQGIHYFRRQV